MSDNPQTPGDTSDPDLPNASTPIARREFADPDLSGTARQVATSIQALVVQVKVLNARAARNRRNIIILAVSLVVTAVLVAAVVLLGLQVFRTAECQGRINDATRSAVIKRSEAFDKQTQALETLASGVIDPVATPERRRATIVQFRDDMRAAKQQRIDNPLPIGNCS